MYPAVVEAGRVWNFLKTTRGQDDVEDACFNGKNHQTKASKIASSNLWDKARCCMDSVIPMWCSQSTCKHLKKKHRSETVAAILIRWPKIPLIDFLPIPWVVHLPSRSDNWRFIKLAIPEPFQESWFSCCDWHPGSEGIYPQPKKPHHPNWATKKTW